ncbi:MAG: hypothetical protein ACI9VR_004305 [Cognaticolwellia sp.]|jgi:hypothetical protein
MSKKAILGKVGLGVLVLGLPAIFLVPYYKSVTEEYGRFHGYMLATVDNPDRAPEWEQQANTPEAFTPEQCVVWGIEWMEECPGTKQFCEGALSSVVRRCVETADRGAYCEGLDQAWMTTGFGYHECEDRVELLTEDDKGGRKKREKACAAGYRSIANHCRDLTLK